VNYKNKKTTFTMNTIISKQTFTEQKEVLHF